MSFGFVFVDCTVDYADVVGCEVPECRARLSTREGDGRERERLGRDGNAREKAVVAMTLPKQSPLLIKREPPLSHRHQQSLPPILEVNASDEVQLEGEADGLLGHIIAGAGTRFAP